MCGMWRADYGASATEKNLRTIQETSSQFRLSISSPYDLIAVKSDVKSNTFLPSGGQNNKFTKTHLKLL